MKPILAELGLLTIGTEEAWAVTSQDDTYRYVLGRSWDGDLFGPDSTRPLWVFGMLNPSKARVENDPTVTKCIGFAKRGGACGLLVVNAMAYSTPYPKSLVEAERSGVDVFGPANAEAIAWAMCHARSYRGRRIAAWGCVPAKVLPLAERGIHAFLYDTFLAAPARVDCFGHNADGTPCHPLMLGYDTPIVPLIRRAA